MPQSFGWLAMWRARNSCIYGPATDKSTLPNCTIILSTSVSMHFLFVISNHSIRVDEITAAFEYRLRLFQMINHTVPRPVTSCRWRTVFFLLPMRNHALSTFRDYPIQLPKTFRKSFWYSILSQNEDNRKRCHATTQSAFDAKFRLESGTTVAQCALIIIQHRKRIESLCVGAFGMNVRCLLSVTLWTGYTCIDCYYKIYLNWIWTNIFAV